MEQNVSQFEGPEPVRLYFAVSPLKLVVMSIVTFGLYELYWFYENWKLVKERTRQPMSPFWRAFFGVFWCHALFKEIRSSADAHGTQATFQPGAIAVTWIVLTLAWKLPDPVSLITFLAAFALIPVQSAINELNRIIAPDQDPNARFSPANIAGIVIGGLLFVASVISSFLPETAG